MRPVVARAEEALVVGGHQAHMMHFAAVVLAWGEAEGLSGLRPRSHLVDVVLLLVVVPAILRYHRRRYIVALGHHLVLHSQ